MAAAPTHGIVPNATTTTAAAATRCTLRHSIRVYATGDRQMDRWLEKDRHSRSGRSETTAAAAIVDVGLYTNVCNNAQIVIDRCTCIYSERYGALSATEREPRGPQ